jgi:predicted O-methyltransferase YrrM
MEQTTTQNSPTCTLNHPTIRTLLERLHRNAKSDLMHFPKIGASIALDKFLKRRPSVIEQTSRMKNIYVPLSPDQGVFAYLVARSIAARRIVEFGTSFGVSTIYLAAAVKDNGGGIVIGSEIEKTKAAKAQQHLKEAGLDEYTDIRVGDACQTLADPGGEVDMVLIDGLKDLYLPIVKMLTPTLRPGAIVLSDNIYAYKRTLASYVAYMEDPENGFQSVTLPLKDGLQYSVRLSV